jgi:hypothetical protein
MRILCKHCQSSCKKIGLVECESCNAKANRPAQLEKEINEAYKSGMYDEAKKLSEELFRKLNG